MVAMADLKIDELTKHFDNETAVEDLTLAIDDAEFVVIVGPSGCGKSTTLNCIAGLEDPSDGEILLDGTDITRRKPQNRDVAMVFQNYALYPHMSIRENLGFGLKMRNELSGDKRHERVEEVAELLGITELLEKRPKSLSGGQQQRVALGRAIARDPEVFLMDEPLSNLDAKLRTQMRAELLELQEDLGTTTVYVTHDQTEAMTMGDRIAVLNDGELQQLGTPLECYHEPQNRFVAGFIGSPSMNFLPVSFDGEVLRRDGMEYELSSISSSDIMAGQELELGIRPEDLNIVEEPTQWTVSVEVAVVEEMGDVTHIHARLDEMDLIVRSEEIVDLSSTDTIHLEFPEDRIHLFDGRNGEAIVNRGIPE
jgi:multiple sugar transport system ATP-binding protein